MSSLNVPWKFFMYRCRSRISSTLIGSRAGADSTSAAVSTLSISSTAAPATARTTMNVTWHCPHVTCRWKRSSSWLRTWMSQPFKLRPHTGQLKKRARSRMNSMMLIGPSILRRRCSPTLRLAPALDAGAARGPDDGGMDRAGGQHHPVARLELELPRRLLDHERDRAVDAVEDFLVGVAVRCVAIAGPVRPRVARGGLLAQGRHQVVQRRHRVWILRSLG